MSFGETEPGEIRGGEPGENPRLFGADDAVAQIRSMLSAIAEHSWAPVQFEHQS